LFSKRGRAINIPFVTSALLLILGGSGLRSVFTGRSITYRLPLPGPYGPSFHADALSALFVLLAVFLWFVVALYAPGYMKQEGGTGRFALSTLLTLAAVLGLFFAGDLLTLLLCFELMTIASFFWVIHRGDREAIHAGYYYLFFSIGGGLLLALGIVLMTVATGGLPTIGTGPVTPLHPTMFAWSVVLSLIGFGIKAGMVPLHLWLPRAHAVAPTPASALLSGLLIKVGIYGLIRVGALAGWGRTLGEGLGWFGPGLALLGVGTMLVGVGAALLQSDAKRLLAYHSVSQMGYILLGLGIGLALGTAGELGLVGAIYHLFNHALFKAALFLGVGVIYLHTQETDLYKLGGLWRRYPVTAVLMLLAVLGITGAPGLNGYASKTLLHWALSLAVDTGAPWARWVEPLFFLVGVGTAASFAKLYYLIFLAKPTPAPPTAAVDAVQTGRLHLAMALLSVVMVGIGLAPGLLPRVAVVPAVQGLGVASAVAGSGDLAFWRFADFSGMLVTLVLGALVCGAGLKWGVFHWRPPRWLTLEGWGKLFARGVLALGRKGAACYRLAGTAVLEWGRKIGTRLYLAACRFDRSRAAKVGRVNLVGLSADAALLILMLTVLMAWFLLNSLTRAV
jgi:formate hydrogenlyase subunit 3/multisubunit Na+/H+ antiporter MnhD subunit